MKILCIAAALVASTLYARSEPLVVVKTVPPGATLEYRINGAVSQTVPLSPGTYRITVEAISGHLPRRTRHKETVQ